MPSVQVIGTVNEFLGRETALTDETRAISAIPSFQNGYCKVFFGSQMGADLALQKISTGGLMLFGVRCSANAVASSDGTGDTAGTPISR